MTHEDVQRWLDRYVAAWRANEAGPIEALFTEDAAYRYLPYDHPSALVRGRRAIAASWLEHTDAPDAWQASYTPFAVDGRRAVATGSSHYHATDAEPARTYHNVFLLEFDDEGRCSAFTELYMLEKSEEAPEG